MRRDLVEEILADVSDEMFEDILYTQPGGGAAVAVAKAIFGVEPAQQDFEQFGQRVAEATHVTRGLKAKMLNFGKGAVINDGVASYKVLDHRPTGDGRFEVLISLKKL